jgi:hypothetical protein
MVVAYSHGLAPTEAGWSKLGRVYTIGTSRARSTASPSTRRPARCTQREARPLGPPGRSQGCGEPVFSAPDGSMEKRLSSGTTSAMVWWTGARVPRATPGALLRAASYS